MGMTNGQPTTQPNLQHNHQQQINQTCKIQLVTTMATSRINLKSPAPAKLMVVNNQTNKVKKSQRTMKVFKNQPQLKVVSQD